MNPTHTRLARRLLVPVVSLALLAAGPAAPASAAKPVAKVKLTKVKLTKVKEKKAAGSATGRKIR